jgi:SAM-dependent methyltransferase
MKLNKIDFLNDKVSNILEAFLNDYKNLFPEIDIELAKKYIKTNELFKDLTEKWYELEKKNLNEAYELYNHKYYFTDMFNCYRHYSRKYINILNKTKIEDKTFVEHYQNNIKGVLDIGCGCGFTCMHLKHIFPNSKVYGVNLKDTYQFKFCQKLTNEKNLFTLTDDYNNINDNIDLIFASEFFEHIDKPIELVINLIEKFNPKFIVTANAFNTRSIGHFSEYLVKTEIYNKYKVIFSDKKKNVELEEKDGYKIVDQKNISKIFNKYLRKNGYSKLKTGYYNSRPYIWVRN